MSEKRPMALENNDFIERLRKEVSGAKKALDSIKLEMDKARAVGLDVRELTDRFNAQKKQIELIEKVYKV